jgi:hypothetical protein
MAGALAFQCDGYAYEALEIGRGVLMSLQINIRTDITVLEEAHPETARA